MENFRPEWLTLALNAILCALVLTVPLLVGMIILGVLRRGVSEDRRSFEEEVRSKLGEIAESQAEIARQLETLSE